MSSEQVEARVRELVAAARASSGSERDNYLLQSAELVVQHQEITWARNLLTPIDTQQLADTAFSRNSQLLPQVALQDRAYHQAESIFTDTRLEQPWQKLSPDHQRALRPILA